MTMSYMLKETYISTTGPIQVYCHLTFCEQGIWATQEKNAEIFNEAFNTARDVILIFSVNKSGKFQGYVRTLSASVSCPSLHFSKEC